MGETYGFLNTERVNGRCRPECARIKDYSEVMILPDNAHSQEQASRCMDCGTPFCHWACPLGNYIPEWNDLLFQGKWQKAFELLQATNNFPEITGRVCPAHCEYSCVLGINDQAVTIRENELAIIEQAFKEGLIIPRPPEKRTGRKIAVIGSGPGGLAAADQLNKAGHLVTVFEKDDLAGGILRYGIPDFKLEKSVLDRRIKILEQEGIEFRTNAFVGKDFPAQNILDDFDAVLLACGSRIPRDLRIDGRDLAGIHFAMDYLIRSNKRVAGKPDDASARGMDAKGKKVVVIGGGDTGADCLGVALRQQAECVTQIELLSKPPESRAPDCPWPKYPQLLKSSTSHQEGGTRQWSVMTKKFIGEGGRVKKLLCAQSDCRRNPSGSVEIKECCGTDFEIEADLVILALGFAGPERKGLVDELGLELDLRNNVKTDENFMTSRKGVFSCADMHRGQSLVVWAVSEGRRAAHCVDKYLTGKSSLPVI